MTNSNLEKGIPWSFWPRLAGSAMFSKDVQGYQVPESRVQTQRAHCYAWWTIY